MLLQNGGADERCRLAAINLLRHDQIALSLVYTTWLFYISDITRFSLSFLAIIPL